MSKDDLKIRTARGSMITGGVTLLLRPVNIFASFLLLRLLDPADFGVVALAMLLLNTSNLFSTLGLGSALIHSPHDKRKTAWPAFVMMMGFALLLFFVVYFNLPLFAQLLGDGEVVPILRWLSFLILINTANTTPASLLRKELMFGRIGIVSMLYQIAYTAVSVTLAILGYGVWSLVYAQLSSSLLRTVAFFVLCPGWSWLKPHRWDLGIIRELLNFGLQNTGGGLLNYFHTHWDDWLVGRMLGTQALGFYSKAYDLTNNTIKQISDNVIGTVFFPSYTKIQDNTERLTRAYIKSVRLVLLIVVPMALGVVAIAPEMVRVLWGSRWVPMIPLLQIYGFMLLSRPISTNTAPLFLGLGRPSYNTRAAFVLLGVMMPLAFLLLPAGIVGVSIAVVISHFVGALFNVYQVNTLLPGSARKTATAVLAPIVAGVIMMAGVIAVKYPLRQMMENKIGFPGLFFLIGVGGLIYLPIVYFTQRDLVLEIWHTSLALFSRRLPFLRAWIQRPVA